MGNRPTDWHVLDLDEDPTPGDPDRVKQLARELHDFADDVADALRQIKGMAGEDALLRWAGKTAKAFQDEFEEVPKNLRKLQRSYDLAGDALAAYWPKLERAQSLADKALARGREARSELSAAAGRLDSATSWVERATAKTEEYDEKEGKEKPDDSEVRAATRNATDAKSAQTSAQTAVDNAESGLEAAKKMAADAKKMREDAASDAKDKLEDASDAGIQNRKWWEKAVDWVKDNWDTIVTVCKVIVAVLGIVVLIIGGPLAWVVLAAALVVLADTLVKYMNGEASLWDVAFAALDCIPGLKGLTTLGGLAKGLKGLKGGLAGLKSMKSAVLGLAKRGGDMLANGAKGAYNRLKSVVRGCGDPVDAATGHMFLEQTDIALPGALPLVFRRRSSSAYRAGQWFGPSWSSSVDQHLEIAEAGIVFATEDGLLLSYPHPEHPGAVAYPETGPRWPLTLLESGAYSVTGPASGHTRHFAPPDDAGLALISRISDRNGHTIDFVHDDLGTPTDIRHSGGYHLELRTEGRRVTALILKGSDDVVVKRFGYDHGNLTEDVNSSGLPLRFGYDARSRIVSWTDRNDSGYSYVYDDQDRCVRQAGQGGHLTSTFRYDNADDEWPGRRITTVENGEGAVTRFVVNDDCQVVAEIDPCGGVTRTSYDEHHHVRSWQDPLGQTTLFTRDESGLPLSIERSDGAVTRYTYNRLGLPTEITLPDAQKIRCEYDDRGNVTRYTDQAGATTHLHVDGSGHLVAMTDPAGDTTRIRTDAAGLPVETVDPYGGTVHHERNGFGRPVLITGTAAGTKRLRWTTEGRLAQVVHADGSADSWTYDGEGNCTGHTDANSGVTRYEYTHFDLLTARTEPDGTRYEFRHDQELRLTEVVNPQGLAWSYSYDAAGRLVAETDFDGRTLSYDLDPAGRVVTITNDLGRSVHYRHDALGQIVRKEADGRATHYAYDQAGRLTRAENPDSTVVQVWDPAGRLTSASVNGRETTYSYDAAGRRTRRTTPAGHVSTWSYDSRSRRTTLTAAERTIAFELDGIGREISRRIGGFATISHDYDDLGHLSGQTVTAPGGSRIQQRSYTYRSDGHLVREDDRLAGSRSFDLDPTGRVLAVRARDWTERYAYDAAGNQTAADWPATHPERDAVGPRSYTGTRITGAGNVRYEHDSLGRIVLRQKKRLSRKPETWRYEWDAEDRLTSVTTPDGARWRYTYDPLGRRVAKERMAPDGGTVVERVDFVWDGTLLCEQTSRSAGSAHAVTMSWDHDRLSPVAQTERIHAADAPQSEIDSRFFAIVTDLIGTPRELVDESGTVAWRSRSTLWGSTSWNSGATAYTPLRFPGQYHDPETGLHYNYFRHYDPETARYLTPDPLGLAPAPNPASYVHNPTTWADPNGLTPCLTKFKFSLDTRAAVGKGNSQAYQIRHCGPTEYRAAGGGERVWADGIDANTGELLDTKFVEKPGRSPFIPDSPNIPDFIRTKIVDEIDDEFARYGAVINDPANPLTGLRVITNHPDAVPFFQGKMQQHGIPGRVDLAP
ncbi:RHS repeat-associated core domain-containing protein [Streptomyces sp. 184]|uniref:RHS repeat-associated core domain-containing protein n=1 Tax=Streptomyces sp. 184 TaxID=1827526 RepID=UPI0038927834